uniref:Intu_longin_1 domain-containing protein n=1 Tax=Parastrongyloides trichosuri TaxID=131310 RepID=A0A0N4Z4A9_PARTI
MNYNPFYYGSCIFTEAKELSISKPNTYVKLLPLLDYFFVTCPEFGLKEGYEKERILFYYPTNENIKKQIDVTGYSDAVYSFTNNFMSNSKPLKKVEFEHRFLTSEKYSQIMIRVENGRFTIGISLKKKECKEVDYMIHLKTIKIQLVNSYLLFKLFNGTITKNLDKNKESCKVALNNFFLEYLDVMKLNTMPLIDLFNGVDMLPLKPPILLMVERFLAHLMCEFPDINKVMMLYQDRLVWHSVPKQDLLILFTYVTKSLLSSSSINELQPESFNSRRLSLTFGSGKFIAGIPENDEECRKVFLTNPNLPNGVDVYNMVVFRCLNATICLFMKKDPTLNSLTPIGRYFDCHLPSVASDLGDNVVILIKPLMQDVPIHYIYHNPLTLSLSTSFIPSVEISSLKPNITKNVLKLTLETYDHFINEEDPFGHVQVKSDDNWFIFFKKFNYRLVILFYYDPNNTSNDNTEYFTKILKKYMENILLV